MTEHTYQIQVQWTGDQGQGTKDYKSYERSFLIHEQGKPDILGSADPNFRGDPQRWNPEEMLIGSIASCHMLWYLHLLSMQKIIAVKYEDSPQGTLELSAKGEGKIVGATLNPVVVITDGNRLEEAKKLHEKAHDLCFIVNSVNFTVQVKPTVLANADTTNP
jgi:organic hydroperoxide reductase OsmC/OhrA